MWGSDLTPEAMLAYCSCDASDGGGDCLGEVGTTQKSLQSRVLDEAHRVRGVGDAEGSRRESREEADGASRKGLGLGALGRLVKDARHLKGFEGGF